jgi:hypothetical protein
MTPPEHTSGRTGAPESVSVERELSPGRSIRAYCVSCSGGSRPEVALCPAEECSLWSWRFGQRPETRGVARRPGGMTATEAIHTRCRDCYEFPRKDCEIPDADCALHHIRVKAFDRTRKQPACRSTVPSTMGVERDVAPAKGKTP